MGVLGGGARSIRIRGKIIKHLPGVTILLNGDLRHCVCVCVFAIESKIYMNIF